MAGAQSFYSAYFGRGVGSIVFANIHCGGGESRLIDCSRSTSTFGCNHGLDIGVKCQIRTSNEEATRSDKVINF